MKVRSPSAASAPSPILVGCLVLLSGGCGLVYQIAWTRSFRLFFGTSTAASSAVVAAFAGGLGAGAMLFGARADRHPAPLALYGRLELGAAATAAATPLLLAVASAIYRALGGSPSLGSAGATVARLLLAAAVLAAPTTLMGGTLPVVVRALCPAGDRARRTASWVYGVNTLGAVAGCMLANFALLERLGTTRTMWAACAVNAVVGLVALTAGARYRSRYDQVARRDARNGSVADLEPGDDVTGAARRRYALIVAAVSGFAFFLMEVVWYRMLAPLLGGSVYTFGLVLAVALLGIGAGGLMRGLARRGVQVWGVAIVCIVHGIALLVPYAAGDRLALLALRLRGAGTPSFVELVQGWAAVAACVVLPAAVVAGVQFPMTIGLLGRGPSRVATHTGRAYAWNTGGAIVGAALGGFVLLPRLGALGCWRVSAVALVLAGIQGASLAWRRDAGVVRLVSLGVLLVVASWLLTREGPTAVWRNSPIGAGRVSSAAIATPADAKAFVRSSRRGVVWLRDGVESTVSLTSLQGYGFLVNGKQDGHARGDAGTQVMLGLLGAALHPRPERALVIGLGTGATAGWLGRVPTMDRVDAVELEPTMLDVARACAPVNENALDNPRVHVVLGDGREVLTAGRGTYDLIASEPSNPYRAGVATLYTRELYEAVARKLRPGGVFVQWLQAYEIGAETVRRVVATLSRVFRFVDAWRGEPSDLLLVAFNEPRNLDATLLRERLAQEPYDRALRVGWRGEGLEAFLGHFVAHASSMEASRAYADEANTDDRTRVEFELARTVGARDWYDLHDDARRAGLHLLEVRGDVDWGLVAYWQQVARIRNPEDRALEDPDANERMRTILLARAGRLGEARDVWLRRPRLPSTPLEAKVVAHLLTRTGDPAAREAIEALRRWSPAEAEGLLAAHVAERGRARETAGRFEAAFRAFRSDPWCEKDILGTVISSATSFAKHFPPFARQIHAALEQPFAIRAADDARLLARARLANEHPTRVPCAPALEALEPHFPWISDLLEFRAECYERERPGSPLARRAADDLRELDGAL